MENHFAPHSRRDILSYGVAAAASGALSVRALPAFDASTGSSMERAQDPGRMGTTVADEEFRDPADEDDSPLIARALRSLLANGHSRLHLPKQKYVLSEPIDLAHTDGLTVSGNGMYATTLCARDDVELASALTATAGCSNLTITDLAIEGTAVDDVTEPRRARSFAVGGITTGMHFRGSYSIGAGASKISNIRVDGVRIYGTRGLPALFTGIEGVVVFQASVVDNCMDIGFTFTESVIFTGNRVTRSADNGVSFSRGTQSVVCVANSFDLCAYWAIWIGGFVATDATRGTVDPAARGAKDVTINGNVGTNLGYGGVSAEGGPTDFTIVGNTFRNLYRGPLDGTFETGDQRGVGVFVTGFPAEAPREVESFATNFLIAHNLIVDARRGGVSIRGARNGAVLGNVIVRPGEQFRKDGVTEIGTNEPTQNFGIAIESPYSESVDSLMISSNTVIDDRPRRFANHAVWVGAAQRVSVVGNFSVGVRNPQIESSPVVTVARTGSRPVEAELGAQAFDEELGMPIWFSAIGWVDAAGNAIQHGEH